MAEGRYPRGSVVLVPFPFTDLSGRKRRPALVVSPEGFHEEDLILCAITSSRVPERLSEWEVPLAAGDMAEEELPKESVVKVGKLFTTHQSLSPPVSAPSSKISCSRFSGGCAGSSPATTRQQVRARQLLATSKRFAPKPSIGPRWCCA